MAAKTTAELTAELLQLTARIDAFEKSANERLDKLQARVDDYAKAAGDGLDTLGNDLRQLVASVNREGGIPPVQGKPAKPPKEGDEFHEAHEDATHQTVVRGKYPGQEVSSRLRPELQYDVDAD